MLFKDAVDGNWPGFSFSAIREIFSMNALEGCIMSSSEIQQVEISLPISFLHLLFPNRTWTHHQLLHLTFFLSFNHVPASLPVSGVLFQK